MKRFILAALALIITLPTAINVQAQDDDIYYTRRNVRKATYEETKADEWSTEANNDWNVDDYNRRGANATAAMPADTMMTYDLAQEVVHDTLYVVAEYAYSDRIRRFHNPMFGSYSWDPWYSPTFYDPFYWDQAFYDPWWYYTPAFGYRTSWYWNNWMWDYGYYSGWYGGWYSPYYNPWPHYYYPTHVYGYGYNVGYSSRPTHRDLHGGHTGGNFAYSHGRSGMHDATRTRGGSMTDGHRSGNTSLRTGQASGHGRNATAHQINSRGASLRQSNMYGGKRTNGISVRGNNSTASTTVRSTQGQRTVTTNGAVRTNRTMGDNSAYRRQSNGVHQTDRGHTQITTSRRGTVVGSSATSGGQRTQSGSTYTGSSRSSSTMRSGAASARSGSSSSRSSGGYSGSSSGGGYSGSSRGGGGGYSGGSNSGYSSGSSSSSSRSSGSYSSGSSGSSRSSGGSYSGGGHSGGGHSGGGGHRR